MRVRNQSNNHCVNKCLEAFKHRRQFCRLMKMKFLMKNPQRAECLQQRNFRMTDDCQRLSFYTQKMEMMMKERFNYLQVGWCVLPMMICRMNLEERNKKMEDFKNCQFFTWNLNIFHLKFFKQNSWKITSK